jgi:hypothetical protein
MKTKPGQIIKCVLLLFLLFVVQPARGQFVEISAEIDFSSYRSDRTNDEATANRRTISVLCVTSTNTWIIEHDWIVNAASKWLFDGTNVYRSTQITKRLPQEQEDNLRRVGGFATAPFESARSNITVNIWPSPDGNPLGDEGVNIPWLAFCSGPYLKREGRLIPLLSDNLRHTPDRYAYTDRTETFADAFGLPRSIDLFLSRSLYLTSAEGFYKGWGTRYLPYVKAAVTNLPEAALMFHYSVTATTNFLSWTFPLRFEFFQKPRSFVQNGDWFKHGVGTLKTIREVAAPTGVFDPGLHQSVVDWRFTDEASGADANIYSWSNPFPPRKDDPALQEKFKERIEQARRHKESAK